MNRVAIVTGGARGIPRAVAEDLASDGWAVAICYRKSEADARDTIEAVEAAGSRGLALEADVSDSNACAQFVEAVRREFGPIGALVNGAGPYHRAPILEETPEAWRSMFDNNLHAAFYMARLVAPDMIEAGWGRILNFSMANADRLAAQPMVTAHIIAKTGLLILTRTLARKLAPHGVTVNAISPGYIDSASHDAENLDAILPRIPAGRLGTVDDAVRAARFLFSEDAVYINSTNLHLSGGWGL